MMDSIVSSIVNSKNPSFEVQVDSFEKNINMIIKLAMLVGMLVFCNAILTDDLLEWHFYKHKFSKNYKSVEDDLHHMVIWLEHKHKIDEHNKEYENGIATFRMELNKYSDLEHHEFISKMTGAKEDLDEDDRSSNFEIPTDFQLPASIDWRDHGAVTYVKDQQHCGSCWSFATTGAIEGQYFRKSGQLLALSEQNLVDCATSNFGCGGGYITKAFQDFIWSGKGIETEDKYPYVAMNGFCRNYPNATSVHIRDFVRIPPRDELKLQQAIATVGPVAVLMDASNPSFHHYSSGIYYDDNCNFPQLSHAVLIVGFGTDEHERDYYIVKNSWGPDWGEDGYFKIVRNHQNHCGIATQASYPIV